MELIGLNINVVWNLVQDTLQKDVQTLFDEQKVDEIGYKENLKTHNEVFFRFCL